MKKKLEIHIQQEIILWFSANFSPSKGIIFPVPNEALYNNAKLSRLRGVSDLVVVLPGKVMFVEVKQEKGVQSKLQEVFERNVTGLGHTYAVVRSLDEFKSLIFES